MYLYLTKRILGAIPVLIIVAAVVFLLMQLAPGDAVSMLISDQASEADKDRIRAAWGLDQPPAVQFISFLGKAMTGDFGMSFRFREPVMELVIARLPATIELALAATLVAIAVGIPLGVLAGARPDSIWDSIASTFSFAGISMPNFWIGIMLILLFAGQWHLLPSGGREPWGLDLTPITGFHLIDAALQGRGDAFVAALRHLALPAIVLGTNMMGIITQMTRAAVQEALHEDYVMTARAKGLSPTRILWRHAFRNALIGVVTVIGLEFGALLSGAMIVEAVFAWPGIGSLLVQGITGRDFPLIIGLVLVYTTIFILVNLLIDILYTVIDPRIRVS
ncbi:ABC transporter permease [Ketogulonicigenium vulgare]|uniref:Putative dipeptide transport system permease protein DppB-like protein n=1 Tax=Ketogulonicigenium vulgare (strain WSH-001) TaxID=759362 RepID=F9YBC0_KETVW|nr:ABC transporter permease [Ketogulonicigenium vulgare]ADO44149.1 dipeptide transport system permease protein dppB [Ketogulonicigenium vulgare Y25]AEM42672.1 putative dipeptide transport system permease protein DppB-like protein [Ketogulonicigenium vulgare WSH-001]ALJ82477.1 peptide ABC transporter permease [Ketogulonicigenium vulgare]ANW35261.1 peptide ABC transporter permease [Ketogulonicigenium vulgare]AOZ53373.1 dipeptide transport system permease protein dppB [Ketogulonicigenium vulgare]